jgi:UDP-N-acetylmuramyl pentapeptide phosphotransferase/UDP-N-acetylglucosamine-1-phosphate transferase
MQVTGKPVPTSVGGFFIVFAVISAVVIMRHANESQSPLLYVCIFGGLFVGVFGILGIAVVHENLHKKSRGPATRR